MTTSSEMQSLAKLFNSLNMTKKKDGSNSLNERTKKEVHVADVVRHGEKILIPENMPIASAIQVLTSTMVDEETMVSITEEIDCFPWEGAIAFRQAVEEQFGYSRTIATPGFFGSTPPSEIAVETGIDQITMAPWGRFVFGLAADDGDQYLQTGVTTKGDRVIFGLGGVVKKKFRSIVASLAKRTREIVTQSSIYRGQAIRIQFTDGNGDALKIPKPSFIDVSKADLENIVYTRDLEQLMDVNVLTPLRNTQACRDAKIPLKRGVLLAGPYGTGKSIFALAVANIAVANGWTYIYIKNASELPHAIRFAKLYQPAVIFAEDVDRDVTGERTEAMDQILNTLDGVDSKSSELMVVLTTNHLELVNRAMLRPGRLDVILHVTPPDAEAAMRLMRAYGRGIIEEETDLGPAGLELEGQTPAVIREAVERSKLMSISRTGDAAAKVNGEDLRLAARTIMQQQALLADPPTTTPSWGDQLVHEIAEAVRDNGVDRAEKDITKILESI